MSHYQNIGATFIFLLTWILILPQQWKFLPLGRSVSAIFGAALVLCLNIVTMDEAAFFVSDGIQVLILLFGLMILSNVCDKEGFFDLVEKGMTKGCKTGASLMLRVVFISGILSAIITNDAVCIFMTAPVVRIAQKYNMKKTPLLIALGTSANIGSAATLSGNPQNAYIGINSEISYMEFLLKVGAAAVIGLFLNFACLWVYDPETMKHQIGRKRAFTASGVEIGESLIENDANKVSVASSPDSPKKPRHSYLRVSIMKGFLLLDLAVLVILFLLGYNLAMVCMGCGLFALFCEAAILQYEPKPVMEAVDYGLLIFFSGLFIVVGSVTATGYPQAIWNSIFSTPEQIYTVGGIALFSLIVLVASNMISNVPAVVLATPLLVAMADAKLAWLLLAWVSTVSGNLTVIGSAAMIIVAERANIADPSCVLSTTTFMKFGVPSTMIITTAGIPIIYAVNQLFDWN